MFPLLIPFLVKAATITVSNKVLISGVTAALAYDKLKSKDDKPVEKKPEKD